jgi:phospholipid transport system transporter-binding protein
MAHPAVEVFRPAGPLTMASAFPILTEGRARALAGDLLVDLSALTEVDSAALALLLDWIRTARSANHRLGVTGMPDGLASLAELYGVSELLPTGEVQE